MLLILFISSLNIFRGVVDEQFLASPYPYHMNAGIDCAQVDADENAADEGWNVNRLRHLDVAGLPWALDEIPIAQLLSAFGKYPLGKMIHACSRRACPSALFRC